MNAMNACGVIFSNRNDETASCLTDGRTLAAVPFGARYRLVDFPLSAMSRAGIGNVIVAANCDFDSLATHIGDGAAWDLSRRAGGVEIVSPFRFPGGKMYHTHLGALLAMRERIENLRCEYLLFCDCGVVMHPDLAALLRFADDSGADAVLLCAPAGRATEHMGDEVLYVTADSDARVRDMLFCRPFPGGAAYLGCMAVRRNALLSLLADADVHGYASFRRDLLLRSYRRRDFRVLMHEGPYVPVHDLPSYYAASMQLLTDGALRRALLENPDHPLYTAARAFPPAMYAAGAFVRNSLLSEGCRVEGTVENCVLFRGVTVEGGAVVRNTVLMEGATVGRDSRLFAVCAACDAQVRAGRDLCGHPEMPLFLAEGRAV